MSDIGFTSHPHLTLTTTTPRRACEAPTHSTSLIQPAAIVAILAAWTRDLECYRRRTPHSEVVHVLESVCADLSRALREASAADIWMTVDDVAERIGKSASTVTRICRAQGAAAGASKSSGSWKINWPRFEHYWGSNDTTTKKEAA